MEKNGRKVHNRIHSSAGDIIVKAFAAIFIGIIAIACFYPLLMVLSVSLSDNAVVTKKGFSAIPQAFTFDTYRYLFTRSGNRIASCCGEVQCFVRVVIHHECGWI